MLRQSIDVRRNYPPKQFPHVPTRSLPRPARLTIHVRTICTLYLCLSLVLRANFGGAINCIHNFIFLAIFVWMKVKGHATHPSVCVSNGKTMGSISNFQSLPHTLYFFRCTIPYGGSTVQGVGVGLWCGVASAGSGNLITFNSLPYMYLRKYIQ